MSDAGIGRLLISSLHQGISDVAPMRLEFYENWLSPTGMRDGRIGLAPLGAVLSFLHREEPPTNAQIAERAGTCAADWTYAGVSSLRRWFTRRMPTGLRVRAAMNLLRRLAKATIRYSKVKASVGSSGGSVEIRSAAFEQLRDPASIPMRDFYAAALQRLLAHCSVDAKVGAGSANDAGWSLTVTVKSTRRVEAADTV